MTTLRKVAGRLKQSSRSPSPRSITSCVRSKSKPINLLLRATLIHVWISHSASSAYGSTLEFHGLRRAGGEDKSVAADAERPFTAVDWTPDDQDLDRAALVIDRIRKLGHSLPDERRRNHHREPSLAGQQKTTASANHMVRFDDKLANEEPFNGRLGRNLVGQRGRRSAPAAEVSVDLQGAPDSSPMVAHESPTGQQVPQVVAAAESTDETVVKQRQQQQADNDYIWPTPSGEPFASIDRGFGRRSSPRGGKQQVRNELDERHQSSDSLSEGPGGKNAESPHQNASPHGADVDEFQTDGQTRMGKGAPQQAVDEIKLASSDEHNADEKYAMKQGSSDCLDQDCGEQETKKIKYYEEEITHEPPVEKVKIKKKKKEKYHHHHHHHYHHHHPAPKKKVEKVEEEKLEERPEEKLEERPEEQPVQQEMHIRGEAQGKMKNKVKKKKKVEKVNIATRGEENSGDNQETLSADGMVEDKKSLVAEDQDQSQAGGEDGQDRHSKREPAVGANVSGAKHTSDESASSDEGDKQVGAQNEGGQGQEEESSSENKDSGSEKSGQQTGSATNEKESHDVINTSQVPNPYFEVHEEGAKEESKSHEGGGGGGGGGGCEKAKKGEEGGQSGESGGESPAVAGDEKKKQVEHKKEKHHKKKKKKAKKEEKKEEKIVEVKEEKKVEVKEEKKEQQEVKEEPKVEEKKSEKEHEKGHKQKHAHIEVHQHKHFEHHEHINLNEPEKEMQEHPQHYNEEQHEMQHGLGEAPVAEHHGEMPHQHEHIEMGAPMMHHHKQPIEPEHHEPIKEHWMVPDLHEKPPSEHHPHGAIVIEDHSLLDKHDYEHGGGVGYQEDHINYPHGFGLTPVAAFKMMGAYSEPSRTHSPTGGDKKGSGGHSSSQANRKDQGSRAKKLNKVESH